MRGLARLLNAVRHRHRACRCALRHRRAAPFVTAMTGLTFMGGALAVPHGYEEAVLTIIGVALVSLGHILNMRHTRHCEH